MFKVATHGEIVVLLFLGFGAPVLNSVLLVLASTQTFVLEIELILLGAGAAATPWKKLAVPNPTKSTIVELEGVAPLKAVVRFTRATFPVVPLIDIAPVAFAVGRAIPIPPPLLS